LTALHRFSRIVIHVKGSRVVSAALVLGAACLAGSAAVAAQPSAQELADQSVAECYAGRAATDHDVRKQHFDKGQALAEQAVKLDDDSARAHFGLFCNLGENLRVDGEKITSVLGLRRLQHEVDRTLELDPNNADALATKGTLLLRLPRLFGGDEERGEKMLRRVLVLDDNAIATRLTLARYVESRGDRDEAVQFATRALQIAKEQGRADKVAEAQSLLAELGQH
jgi:tetratricopeptide (TPR) repeat protein